MLTLLLAAIVIAGVPADFAPLSTCPIEMIKAGLCSGTGNDLIISDERNTPGTNNPIGDPGPGPGPGGPGTPRTEFDFGECLADWNSYIRCFRESEEDTEQDPTPDEDEPGVPAVTIADLARFAPQGSALTGEPDNVGVAGLPTNFVTTASVHTVSGSLFGYPITVRFTPVGYDFDYGDGSAATTTEGGTTWEALGQPQFTPTPTSHTYAERGVYTARVDVRYTAEVDLGIGWFPISGQLTATGPAQEIRIFEAHTALVAHTCEQAPSSPGC